MIIDDTIFICLFIGECGRCNCLQYAIPKAKSSGCGAMSNAEMIKGEGHKAREAKEIFAIMER